MAADRQSRTRRHPPAPGRLPIAGHILQWRRDPVKLLTEAARQGDVVRLALPGATFLLTHPTDVKHVLQDNHQNYCKGWVFDRIKPYWGESLLTADGDTWRQQRRRVQPSFKREHTAGFAPIVTAPHRRDARSLGTRSPSSGRAARALQRDDPAGARHHRRRALRRGPVDAMPRRWPAPPRSALAVLKKRVAALAPLPLWIPTPRQPPLQRRDAHAATIGSRRSSTRKRDAGDDAPSFLTMLMEARDAETGARMTDRQLHEEILGMLQQGHDTVGESLAWTWYLLSLHPEVERKLHDEVSAGRRRSRSRSSPTSRGSRTRTWSCRSRCGCIRRSGSSRATPSMTTRSAAIGFLPGSTILLSPYLTHRHPDFWENPEAFDPDRFLPARSQDRPRHAYFPFGGGPRLCMGVDMAMMEMLLIMAMVVQRYRLHLVSGHREEPECILDMIPRHRVRATLHRQHPLPGPRGGAIHRSCRRRNVP